MGEIKTCCISVVWPIQSLLLLLYSFFLSFFFFFFLFFFFFYLFSFSKFYGLQKPTFLESFDLKSNFLIEVPAQTINFSSIKTEVCEEDLSVDIFLFFFFFFIFTFFLPGKLNNYLIIGFLSLSQLIKAIWGVSLLQGLTHSYDISLTTYYSIITVVLLPPTSGYLFFSSLFVSFPSPVILWSHATTPTEFRTSSAACSRAPSRVALP